MGSTVEAIMNPESQAPDRVLVSQARDGEQDARDHAQKHGGNKKS